MEDDRLETPGEPRQPQGEDRTLQPGATVRCAPVVRRQQLDIVSLGEEGDRELGKGEAGVTAGGRDRPDDEDPHRGLRAVSAPSDPSIASSTISQV